jgi:hypothetical protein
VFENRVLRGIFGPKREEETGDWRKIRNEEIHDLYQILVIERRRIRWVRHVARVGEKGHAYRVAVGKTEYM